VIRRLLAAPAVLAAALILAASPAVAEGNSMATCTVSPNPVTVDQTFTVTTSGLDPANMYVLTIAPPHGVYEFQTLLLADTNFTFTANSPWQTPELNGL
jgi:hypothetical protein